MKINKSWFVGIGRDQRDTAGPTGVTVVSVGNQFKKYFILLQYH